MKTPTYVTQDLSKRKPILVIDKKGDIGLEICRLLYREFLPVLVSEIPPDKELSSHVISIPFKRSAPKIPENRFTHIFFVDTDNRYVSRMFPSVLRFAKATNTDISFITSIYLRRPKGIGKLIDNPLVRLFIMGDVFSEKDDRSPVSSLLSQAFYEKQITLPNHGLDEIYTTSVYEISKEIVAMTFSQRVSHQVVCLYTDYAITLLSISRHVLGIDPEVKVDFRSSRTKAHIPKWSVQNGWHVSVAPLDTQLRDVYERFSKGRKPESKKRNKRLPPIPFGPYLAGAVVAVFFVLLLPLLFILTSGFLGKALTSQAVELVQAGEYEASRSKAQSADAAFQFADTLTTMFIPVGSVIGQRQTVTSFSHTLQTGSEINHVIIDASYAFEDYEKSTKTSQREEAYLLGAKAIQRLKQTTLSLLPIIQHDKLPEEYQSTLDTYERMGQYFLAVSDVLPDVLGYKKPMTYLVLFQNNNELRPGGGFIGSYGLLTLDRGSIEDLKIHDVYDADGQLSAHIEPPEPLKAYMGVTHWYLRDSNFSPDFIENAARAAYFLKLETGESVDGVFAIDTTFLQYLLKATGPVTVEEYGQTVTSENFSESTQSQIEDNFFPGSQTKRTFLSAVSDDVYQKLLGGEGIVYELVLSGLVDALSQKHLMVAFADESLQLPFTASNLSGSLWDPREETAEGIADYVGIVEANVGLNKVNPYIERYISQKTSYGEDGRVVSTLGISYKNTSTASTKFGGLYKNYLQILMPLDTDVTGIGINGEDRVVLTSEQAQVTKNLEGAEIRGNIIVDRQTISDKRSIGFLVEVPPEGETTVDITLQKQTAYTENSPVIDYNVLLFKQPGRIADPYTFTFLYPNSYQVLGKSSALKGEAGEITAFFLLDSDREFEVSLGKK